MAEQPRLSGRAGPFPPIYPGDFGRVAAALRKLDSALAAGDALRVSEAGDELRASLGGTDLPSANDAVLSNDRLPAEVKLAILDELNALPVVIHRGLCQGERNEPKLVLQMRARLPELVAYVNALASVARSPGEGTTPPAAPTRYGESAADSSSVRAIVAFVRRHTQTNLTPELMAERSRLDAAAHAVIQRHKLPVYAVATGGDGYGHFGGCKIPCYTANPTMPLAPTDEWFRMMEDIAAGIDRGGVAEPREFDFDSFIRQSQADAERMHEARLGAAEACETTFRQRQTIVLRHDLAVRLYKMLGRLPTAYEAGEFHAERLCGLVAMLREGGLAPESWDIRPDPRPSMASAQGEMLAACSLWGLAVAGERDALADRLRQLFEVPDHGHLASAFYHWLTDEITEQFDMAVGLINADRTPFEEAALRIASYGRSPRGPATDNPMPTRTYAAWELDPAEEALIEVLNDPPPSPSAPYEEIPKGVLYGVLFERNFSPELSQAMIQRLVDEGVFQYHEEYAFFTFDGKWVREYVPRRERYRQRLEAASSPPASDSTPIRSAPSPRSRARTSVTRRRPWLSPYCSSSARTQTGSRRR